MLFIINCKAIYSYPWLGEYVRYISRDEHKVAVTGEIRDLDSGKIESAKLHFSADDHEIMANDNPRSNIEMIRLLLNRHKVEYDQALVVSDMPSDDVAASSLGVKRISPLIFEKFVNKILSEEEYDDIEAI